MGYFSVYGHRSPNLEGRPGKHARVMIDIPNHALTFYEKVNKKYYLEE